VSSETHRYPLSGVAARAALDPRDRLAAAVVNDHLEQAPQPSSAGQSVTENQKRAAALEAAELVQDRMRVGLGTGTTVAYLLPALAKRALRDLRCVPSSPATEHVAVELGLPMTTLDELGGALDIAIDGADEIDPHGWLIKGRGGAHAREKLLAAAARRFVVIASAEKPVPALRPPVPIEVLRFGAAYTFAALAPVRPRRGALTPDGNLLADYLGAIEEPRRLAARLSATPGLVEHGLFEPELVSDILIAGPDGVAHRRGRRSTS
jgi:ribose 5-phosphate isomerase A